MSRASAMREAAHTRSALARPDEDRIIYDLTGIEEQYDVLLGELPGVAVRFAMKACPSDEVLTCLADRGAGFDGTGPGEIRQALDDVAALLPEGTRLDHVNLDGDPLSPPTGEIFAAIRAGVSRLGDVPRSHLGFIVELGRHLVADQGTVGPHVIRLTERNCRLEFPTRAGSRSVPAVARPTCDSDDTLGGVPVPVPVDLASGDPVWSPSAGAYALSSTTVGFNGYGPLPRTTVRAERIRPIDADDWCAIVDLEADAYSGTGHSETRTALESRARSSPATSFVLDVGESVRGYLIALPYPRFRFPELDRVEETVFRSSNLHLHDISIAKEIRGRGWAKRLLRHLTDTARSTGYEQISLVAVGGTTGFWSAHGYRAHPEVSLSRTYGPDAIYMSRVITGEG
ncbi:GNAT family N-acetyltransferase [Actinosynnema sp. NPDC051121]